MLGVTMEQVPTIPTDLGPVRLSILMTPPCAPTEVGLHEKVTERVLELLGFRVKECGAAIMNKVFVTCMSVMLNDAVPAFLIVSVCVALDFTHTVPKSSRSGIVLIRGAGAKLMVNPSVSVAFCPSGLVTITSTK